MKDYLLRFLTTAAPENGAGQDALEWAIQHGLLRLSYDFPTDLQQAAQQYDTIFESYHAALHQQAA